MAQSMSNLLRAVLLTDDITTGVANPARSQCYTVQHFEYKCQRDLDDAGMPFGFTTSVILSATVKISASSSSRTSLERLKQDSRYPFTFLFNPVFDADKRVSDYGDGMVVYGYVVDVEQRNKDSELNFNILVSSMTYLGRDTKKSLYITHSTD